MRWSRTNTTACCPRRRPEARFSDIADDAAPTIKACCPGEVSAGQMLRCAAPRSHQAHGPHGYRPAPCVAIKPPLLQGYPEPSDTRCQMGRRLALIWHAVEATDIAGKALVDRLTKSFLKAEQPNSANSMARAAMRKTWGEAKPRIQGHAFTPEVCYTPTSHRAPRVRFDCVCPRRKKPRIGSGIRRTRSLRCRT